MLPIYKMAFFLLAGTLTFKAYGVNIQKAQTNASKARTTQDFKKRTGATLACDILLDDSKCWNAIKRMASYPHDFFYDRTGNGSKSYSPGIIRFGDQRDDFVVTKSPNGHPMLTLNADLSQSDMFRIAREQSQKFQKELTQNYALRKKIREEFKRDTGIKIYCDSTSSSPVSNDICHEQMIVFRDEVDKELISALPVKQIIIANRSVMSGDTSSFYVDYKRGFNKVIGTYINSAKKPVMCLDSTDQSTVSGALQKRSKNTGELHSAMVACVEHIPFEKDHRSQLSPFLIEACLVARDSCIHNRYNDVQAVDVLDDSSPLFYACRKETLLAVCGSQVVTCKDGSQITFDDYKKADDMENMRIKLEACVN